MTPLESTRETRRHTGACIALALVLLLLAGTAVMPGKAHAATATGTGLPTPSPLALRSWATKYLLDSSNGVLSAGDWVVFFDGSGAAGISNGTNVEILNQDKNGYYYKDPRRTGDTTTDTRDYLVAITAGNTTGSFTATWPDPNATTKRYGKAAKVVKNSAGELEISNDANDILDVSIQISFKATLFGNTGAIPTGTRPTNGAGARAVFGFQTANMFSESNADCVSPSSTYSTRLKGTVKVLKENGSELKNSYIIYSFSDLDQPGRPANGAKRQGYYDPSKYVGIESVSLQSGFSDHYWYSTKTDMYGNPTKVGNDEDSGLVEVAKDPGTGITAKNAYGETIRDSSGNEAEHWHTYYDPVVHRITGKQLTINADSDGTVTAYASHQCDSQGDTAIAGWYTTGATFVWEGTACSTKIGLFTGNPERQSHPTVIKRFRDAHNAYQSIAAKKYKFSIQWKSGPDKNLGDKDNHYMKYVTNEASAATSPYNANVKFDDMVFSEPGEYVYEIKEVVPSDTNGIEYDTHVCLAKANVQLGGTRGMTVEWSYEYEDDSLSGNARVFVNREEALFIEGKYMPNVKKTLVGANLKANMFGFKLSDGSGNLLALGANRKNGTIVWESAEGIDGDSVTVSSDGLGVYFDDSKGIMFFYDESYDTTGKLASNGYLTRTFVVREVVPSTTGDPDYKYDTHACTYKLTIAPNSKTNPTKLTVTATESSDVTRSSNAKKFVNVGPPPPPTKSVDKARAEVDEEVAYTVVQSAYDGWAYDSLVFVDPMPANFKYTSGSLKVTAKDGHDITSAAGTASVAGSASSGQTLTYTFKKAWLSDAANQDASEKLTFTFSGTVQQAAAGTTLVNKATTDINDGFLQSTDTVETYVPVWRVRAAKVSDYPDLLVGNSAYSLAGAKFSAVCSKGHERGPLTTGSDGLTGVAEVYHSGTLTVAETAYSPGHKLPSPASKTVALRASNEGRDNLVEVAFTEPPVVLALPVIAHKVDADFHADGSLRLSGSNPWQGDAASFSGMKVRVDFYAGSSPSGTKLASAVFASGSSGSVAFASASPVDGTTWRYRYGGKNVIPLGCVTVTEVAAPAGYLVDPTVHVATVVRDGDDAKLVAGAHWES